jgi:hypothetical protein
MSARPVHWVARLLRAARTAQHRARRPPLARRRLQGCAPPRAHRWRSACSWRSRTTASISGRIASTFAAAKQPRVSSQPSRSKRSSCASVRLWRGADAPAPPRCLAPLRGTPPPRGRGRGCLGSAAAAAAGGATAAGARSPPRAAPAPAPAAAAATAAARGRPAAGACVLDSHVRCRGGCCGPRALGQRAPAARMPRPEPVARDEVECCRDAVEQAGAGAAAEQRRGERRGCSSHPLRAPAHLAAARRPWRLPGLLAGRGPVRVSQLAQNGRRQVGGARVCIAAVQGGDRLWASRRRGPGSGLRGGSCQWVYCIVSGDRGRQGARRVSAGRRRRKGCKEGLGAAAAGPVSWRAPRGRRPTAAVGGAALCPQHRRRPPRRRARPRPAPAPAQTWACRRRPRHRRRQGRARCLAAGRRARCRGSPPAAPPSASASRSRCAARSSPAPPPAPGAAPRTAAPARACGFASGGWGVGGGGRRKGSEKGSALATAAPPGRGERRGPAPRRTHAAPQGARTLHPKTHARYLSPRPSNPPPEVLQQDRVVCDQRGRQLVDQRHQRHARAADRRCRGARHVAGVRQQLAAQRAHRLEGAWVRRGRGGPAGARG